MISKHRYIADLASYFKGDADNHIWNQRSSLAGFGWEVTIPRKEHIHNHILNTGVVSVCLTPVI